MSGSEEGEGAEHPWGCSFLQFSHGGGGGGGEGGRELWGAQGLNSAVGLETGM